MLISPPFLPARGNGQTDSEWINQAMQGGEPGQGGYPVSYNLGWHGGIHLEAPVSGDNRQAVRAIANGTVVYVRKPTEIPCGTRDGNPLNYRGGWTSDGCVVIRHETEFGNATTVTYYSITMHLHSIEKGVKAGERIYRKDKIGSAGYIYGEPYKIHFEIVCDDANLERLVGRKSGDLNIGADGRADVLHGEIYFRLPAGTPIYAEMPKLHVATPIVAVAHTTAQVLNVGLRYASGRDPDGRLAISTYREDGTRIGDALPENEAEYDLFARAMNIINGYPEDARPTHRAVYELLRFGKVITPGVNPVPADVPHWRNINYEGGTGWVNLNALGIRKFSDADFPHWKGWTLIDDSADKDSRCDSPVIQGWLDEDKDGKVDPNEALQLLPEARIQAKMRRTICKIPTEWEKATVDHRWGWLQQDMDSGDPWGQRGTLSCEDFDRLREHIEALAFWEDANIGISTNHWHFHPRLFIETFRTFCTWPDLLSRWYRAEDGHVLPDESGLDFWPQQGNRPISFGLGYTALYEHGLRSAHGARKDHQDNDSYAALRALDSHALSSEAPNQNGTIIFGMRVVTDINASRTPPANNPNEPARGLWDDRVTLLKRDETGLVILIHRGRYTTEPAGTYVKGGTRQGRTTEGKNVGGSNHKDVGRLIANRTYEYQSSRNNSTPRFGRHRFGKNLLQSQKFNILKKTANSRVERLVTMDDAEVEDDCTRCIDGSNTHWQTGNTSGYDEEQTMHFHKGYGGNFTGSAGCQTFPHAGVDEFDAFMGKLEPMTSASRFQYVLKKM